jgi:hypothetical protein
MRGRRSRAATLDDIAEARNRAADTISELAEHAVSLARDAGNAARPAVKLGAEGIGNAFERAADASGKLTSAIRPKKKTHKVRNLLIGAAVVGGIFALVQSPLRSKLQERLFGPPPEDDDLPQITLPDDDHEIDASNGTEIDVTHASDPEPEAAADVVGSPVAAEPTTHRGHKHDDAPADQETNA